MSKKKSTNKTVTKIGTVFVCGYCYDDFSDGGFDIFAICKTREAAKAKVQEEFHNLLNNYNRCPSMYRKKPTIDPYEIREMPLFQ